MIEWIVIWALIVWALALSLIHLYSVESLKGKIGNMGRKIEGIKFDGLNDIPAAEVRYKYFAYTVLPDLSKVSDSIFDYWGDEREEIDLSTLLTLIIEHLGLEITPRSTTQPALKKIKKIKPATETK